MLTPKTRLLIPLLVIAGYLIHSWVILFSKGWSPFIGHYLSLSLFLPLVYAFFKHLKQAIIGTGIYALLATIGILTLTPDSEQFSAAVNLDGSPYTFLSFQTRGFLVFLTYGVLNFDGLVNMYLDYKESKGKK